MPDKFSESLTTPRPRASATGRERARGADAGVAHPDPGELQLPLAHAGEVVTREDLIARVWDENWFGSTKTLDVHVGWLRSKLGDDAAAPRFVHTVRGVGFRFSAPSEWAS